MDRNIIALIAAIVVTALLGGGMYLLGQSPLAASENVITSTQTAFENARIISEYQAREAQCTTQVESAAQRLNMANTQIQAANQQIKEYQSILNQLQEKGMVNIAPDGTITIQEQQNKP